MKKFQISDIRWANTSDLSLPFWELWNRKNPLPEKAWQGIWDYPYLASRVPAQSTSLDIGGIYPSILFPNFPNAISVNSIDLNRSADPFHQGMWPEGKLLVCDITNITKPDDTFDYVFSIRALNDNIDFFCFLQEMLRLAKHRIVISLEVSEGRGVPYHRLRELERFLGVEIPLIPADALNSKSSILRKFSQPQMTQFQDIRILGITIDSIDHPKTVGILIPHRESYLFLKPCLEAIRNNQNTDLKEHVYVLDDNSQDGSFETAVEEFGQDSIYEFHQVSRSDRTENADIGYLLDFGLSLVNEQYVAMIDADVFPLTREWLTFPIWLLEKYRCSMVGVDTGLSNAYLHFPVPTPWAWPIEGYYAHAGLFSNQYFTCINNFYRIMPTSLAKIVSENIGFSLAASLQTRRKWFERIGRRIRKYLSKPGISTELSRFIKGITTIIPHDRYPYLPGGCDNGVAANQFIDINHLGPKFNIPLTSFIGFTPKDGVFGQNICGLIFHFALSTSALSRTRQESEGLGKEYDYYLANFLDLKDSNHQFVDEMIASSITFRPGGYDKSIPASWYEKEFNYIKDLIELFRRSSSFPGKIEISGLSKVEEQ